MTPARITIALLVFACATAAHAERRTLSAKQQREMAREYHVTRSMIRQARECLR